MPINSLLYPSNVFVPTTYNVDNSLRFNDGSSDYLSRTPSSAGNTKKFTISFWLKRGTITGADQNIFHAFPSSGSRSQILFNSSEQLLVDLEAGNTNRLITTRLFRDTSAWYHIVIVYDSDNGTSGNRVIIYINGVRETSFGTETYPSSGSTSQINTTTQHEISSYDGSGSYFDGYLAEFVLLDGTVADATSFGEFDEDSGIWKPIDVSGLTFGTNGFYQEYKQSGTGTNSSGMGADTSGNDNHFAVNNLTAIDQTTDTCTNNFATMNPLDNFFAGSTFTEGNTTVDMTTSGVETFNTSTFAVSSGLWYAECKLIDSSSKPMVGISHAIPIAIGNVLGNSGFGYAYMGEDGQVKAEGSNGAYGATYTTNDIIGVYLDLTANKLYFAKNGALQNSGTGVSITAAASTANGHYFFGAGKRHSDNNQVSWNFGNPSFTGTDKADANGYGSFEYDPSVGTFDGASKDFYALCTKNLAEYG